MTEALMRVSEVCDFLHISGNTLRRWSDQGLLKVFRLGPRGDRRFSREDVAKFLNQGVQLPGRRARVMPLVAQGLSNAEIAEQLHYSVSTVKGHINVLCRLYDVCTRTDLVGAMRLRGTLQ